MRLTTSMRQAFVRSVMDDVPEVDYSEQMKKIALADCVAQLPPKARALYDDATLRNYLNWRSLSIHETQVARPHGYGLRYIGVSVMVPGRQEAKISPDSQKKINELVALYESQSKSREALRLKITGAANAFGTRKALASALPEFEKYLPADAPAADRTLPVLTNVVTDFMKAGWPKGKAKPKEPKKPPPTRPTRKRVAAAQAAAA